MAPLEFAADVEVEFSAGALLRKDGQSASLSISQLATTARALAARREIPALASELLAKGFLTERGREGGGPRSSSSNGRYPAQLGDFVLTEPVGAGGFGDVFRAVDLVSGGDAAVKCLRSPTPTGVQGLRQEVRVLARLDHPALVSPYHLAHDRGRWYLALEFVEGQHYHQYVQAAATAAKVARRVRDTVLQIVDSFAYLHNCGVAHGDLKPENLLVRKGGGIAVLDFGLSRFFTSVEEQPSAVAGTPGFVAPELRLGQPPTPASDAYSVGALVYSALQGQPPPMSTRRQRRGLAAIGTTVGAEFAALVSELLSHDPSARPSMADVLVRLRTSATSVGARRQPEPKQPPARHTQLSALSEVWREVAGGWPQAVWLSGNSRASKGRLLDEFIEQVQSSDGALCVVVRGCRQEYVPYSGLEELYEAVPLRSEKARRALRYLRAIHSKDGHDEADADSYSGDERSATRCLAILRVHLHKLAKAAPLLVAIENAHWIDDETSDFLMQLLDSAASTRIMVALSLDTGSFENLGPLSAWRGARRRGFAPTFREIEVDTADDEHDPETTPWRELDEETREVLSLLAACGRPMDTRRLRDATGARATLRRSLARLERAGVLRTLDDSHAIASEFLRCHVLELMGEDQVRLAHAKLAEAFAQQPADPVACVLHLASAGESQRALALARDAATRAERARNYPRAAALYRVVYSAAQGDIAADELVKFGRCLLRSGECTDAARVLELTMGQEGSQQEHARYLAATACLNAGRTEDGISMLRPLVSSVGLRPLEPAGAGMLRLLPLLPAFFWAVLRRRKLGRAQERERAIDIAWIMGRSLLWVDQVRGLALILQCVVLARRRGDVRVLNRCLTFVGVNILSQIPGLRRLVPKLLAESRQAAQTHDSALLHHAELWEAMMAGFAGDWIEMRDLAEQAACGFGPDPEAVWERVMASLVHCFALGRLGAYSDCSNLASEQISDASRRGLLYAMVAFSQYQDLPTIARGQLERVERRCDWIEEVWLPGRFSVQTFYCDLARAYVALARGETATALEHLDRHHREFRRMGGYMIATPRIDRLCAEARIRIARHAQGDIGQATQIRRIAKRLASESRADGPALATAFSAAVDESRRIDLLHEAAVRFERISMIGDALVCRLHASVLAGDNEGVDSVGERLRRLGVVEPAVWARVLLPIDVPRERDGE